jgi:hypothetical protein
MASSLLCIVTDFTMARRHSPVNFESSTSAAASSRATFDFQEQGKMTLIRKMSGMGHSIKKKPGDIVF